ncbi:metallophosphoesterase [Oscillatoria sp. FACHB-1406]|uniref:metallophosphoesterase family protein n=1 Tax=Oscillatoria sp. FACHB-1406 TaxID=2692846 RepID=UPI001682B0F8|nr:metallophosphoesterase [Oscillatoria sp. FACHB-1406]MBD2577584.1 metallophosphoesterase [Oscillatoria sp. FACHB-1406]
MNFKFAIASDLHLALPHTFRNVPQRFHLVEISIPVIEGVLQHLEQLDLDFLLIPGDLTQDGEPENHQWLQQRLAKLPFPTFVIPGNHDVLQVEKTKSSIALAEFPYYYHKFGYQNPQQLYYRCELLPGVELIGLNSNQFDENGKQLFTGGIDKEQLIWLKETLADCANQLVLVMVHHNAIDHLPNQSKHPLGRRYAIENAAELRAVLRSGGVRFLFSGHLHVQDIAEQEGLYEITTGSLVSYPHPYRILEFKDRQLKIKSYRVRQIPGYDNLGHFSREIISDRSLPLMLKLATSPPLNLPPEMAERVAAQLRYFWADIAAGDAVFDFPDFPPRAQQFFEGFSAAAAIDNDAILNLDFPQKLEQYVKS